MLAVAAGVALLCLVATLIVAAVGLVRAVTASDGAGGDFLSFYAAGHMVRTGSGALLYDARAQEWVQRALYPGTLDHATGYPLPVFTAWLFAPLSTLPFGAAFAVFALLNVSLLAGVAAVLSKHLAGVPGMPRRVFLATFALSIPVVADVVFGQVDLVVFAGLLLGYLLLRRDREVLAGVALSLALVKPHLLVGVVLMLLVWRQWRTLAALAAVGAPLLVLPALLTSGNAISSNLALIRHYPGANADLSVNAQLMSNWRGFVTSLTGSHNVWLWMPGMLAIAAGALAVTVPRWRLAADGTEPADQSYALAVLFPLLVSPHLHTQSLMLIFIPVAIALRGYVRPDVPGSREARRQRDASAALFALYAALFILWLVGVGGLMLMVFLLLALFVLCAYRWPDARRHAREDARAAAVRLTASYRRRYDPKSWRP